MKTYSVGTALNRVISREIRPLEALYPLPPYKKCFIGLRSRSPLSEVAWAGLLMPTAFAPLSIVSVKKYFLGRGAITLPRVWFQGTLPWIAIEYQWLAIRVCLVGFLTSNILLCIKTDPNLKEKKLCLTKLNSFPRSFDLIPLIQDIRFLYKKSCSPQ